MGGLCGVLGAKYIDDNNYGFMGFIITILMLYAAILIQIIIHEGGHLVFGLLSGYKFSSFRIFNFSYSACKSPIPSCFIDFA